MSARRLEKARRLAENTGLCRHSLIHLGGYTWCLFPWLGTRSFRTVRKMIGAVASEFGISGLDFEGSCYLTFRMERGTPDRLLERLISVFGNGGASVYSLVSPKELPTFEKYDKFIPGDLLRHAYATDRLDLEEAVLRLSQLADER